MEQQQPEEVKEVPGVSVSVSVPTLRFPRPEGSRRLANWLSNSAPDLRMQPSDMSSDAGDLGDSVSYEIINSTDSESTDGRLTDCMAESTSSLNASRPDDVVALEDEDESPYGSDRDSDEEEEEREGGEGSDHSSRASSIRYADQALKNPSSSHLSANVISYGSSNTAVSPSIEFREEDDVSVDMDSISVKHTIKEFTAEETAAITKDSFLEESPKRLVATIRQSMAQRCLVNYYGVPFRVLYVGSPAGERDIVKKLSSAICACRTPTTESTEGVYNICQISSFFSTTEPEVELMETSPFQIKVQRCKSAEIVGDGEYSITVDRDKTYKSYVTGLEATVVPHWELPHLAVFYCTEIDDEATVSTRNAAWEMMKRNGVPTMFITHTQSFDQPLVGRWKPYLSPSSLHICLESRDPDVVLERVPIDLDSFMNIDARQMNRNLAFRTGLNESPSPAEFHFRQMLAAEKQIASIFSKLPAAPTPARIMQFVEENKLLTIFVIPLLVSLLATLAMPLLFSTRDMTQASHATAHTTGSWSTITVSTPSKESSSALTTATVTSTVTLNVTATSTKTSWIRFAKSDQATPSVSSLASALSFAGFLSDRPSSVVGEAESRTTLCSVKVHGDNEILVKMPSGSKEAWLAKGVIDIDVYRGNEPIKTKLSSVDEGILVEIKMQDAYGVLNVSVVTTRKPKINETFEVTFGSPRLAVVIEAGVHALQDAAQKAARTAAKAVRSLEGAAGPAAVSLRDRIRDARRDVKRYSTRVVTDTIRRFALPIPTSREEITKLAETARAHLSTQIKQAVNTRKNMQEDVDTAVIRAQIASKLWWLRLRGKWQEHDEYEQKAVQFLRQRNGEIFQARKGREHVTPAEFMCSLPAAKWLCRRDREMPAPRDRLWKRIFG